MSFLDKIAAAITPPESDETRLEARENARAQAVQGGWLSLILDDHDRIERAFEAVRSAHDAAAQKAAERELAVLLNGHSAAEEAVIYPELAESDKTHATMGYEEQAMTKVQLGLLTKLEPMTQEYIDKLEHIRGAVTHHMYQEESSWLVNLEREILPSRQDYVRERYREEMSRYASEAARPGSEADARSAMSWGNA